MGPQGSEWSIWSKTGLVWTWRIQNSCFLGWLSITNLCPQGIKPHPRISDSGDEWTQGHTHKDLFPKGNRSLKKIVLPPCTPQSSKVINEREAGSEGKIHSTAACEILSMWILQVPSLTTCCVLSKLSRGTVMWCLVLGAEKGFAGVIKLRILGWGFSSP